MMTDTKQTPKEELVYMRKISLLEEKIDDLREEKKVIEDLLNEQERRIQTLQRSIERREGQISIIKKYCLQFLTSEEIRTIEDALRKDDLKKGD